MFLVCPGQWALIVRARVRQVWCMTGTGSCRLAQAGAAKRNKLADRGPAPA